MTYKNGSLVLALLAAVGVTSPARAKNPAADIDACDGLYSRFRVSLAAATRNVQAMSGKDSLSLKKPATDIGVTSEPVYQGKTLGLVSREMNALSAESALLTPCVSDPRGVTDEMANLAGILRRVGVNLNYEH